MFEIQLNEQGKLKKYFVNKNLNVQTKSVFRTEI